MFSLKNTKKNKRSCRTLSQTSTNIKDFYIGTYRIKKWVKNNKSHRLHGPAKILYYETGLIQAEAWYENVKKHRLNGPAEILYYETGLKRFERWYENDKSHRLNGPSYIRYYTNFSFFLISYYNCIQI